MDHAVLVGIRYSVRSDSKISRNPAPSSIMPMATTLAASTRRRRGSSPPVRYSASTASPSWVSS